jgi:Ni,Fe-hydrogenase maturation factor
MGTSHAPARRHRENGRAVIIALGNPLRRDDGAALVVADMIERRAAGAVLVLRRPLPDPGDLPGIRAFDPSRVFIVDAVRAAPGSAGSSIVPLAGPGECPNGAHDFGDRSFTGLMTGIGITAAAFRVLVAGSDFGRGEGLADATWDNAREAARRIVGMIRRGPEG